MEVFMRNLPLDLADQELKTKLAPLIKDLRIKDWCCQKPYKKPFGTITFLHISDAEQFLKKYGQKPTASQMNFNGKRTFSPQLMIFNADVFCSKSTRMPDAFALSSLKKSAEDRQVAER
jgi:hypothetical protein